MGDDSDLLREARERYQAGVEADRLNRERDYEDRKFYTGGENQWPQGVVEERRAEGRPYETFNRLPQFVKQVTGEIRQNKPAIKVLPVDDQSDPELADIYSAIIRHIESNSDGHRVYSKETEKAVIGGVGWARVKADYYDDTSFEQDLCIESIPNPNAVVCDPDARELTRSDMKWCFVTELVSREKFEKQYPDVSPSDFDNDTNHVTDWLQGDFVRIAEYWVKKKVGTENLYLFNMPQGQLEKYTETQVKEFLKEQGLEYPSVEKAAEALGVTIEAVRKVDVQEVSSVLMCGTRLLGKWQKWPGKYIPIVRFVGEEVEAGDTVFRHGLIHHAKPPARAYNFARNAMMERHATSTKAPWLIALKQIPLAFKSMWENANRKNYPFLPYEPVPGVNEPKRIDPPQLDAAAYQESLVASEDMKATTGIYDAALGAQSNETSGVAIARRDAQGDTATFVYIDNMEAAITQIARILIDLIPHYYSDERIIRMIGEDGEIERFEAINKLMPDGVKWNDVTRGRFDVVVTTGPAYATKRQEAQQNMIEFIRSDPQSAPMVRDLVAKSMDWPYADKFADRFRKTLPPGIDDEVDKERAEQQQGQPQQPSPEEQAMQAELQMQQAKLQAEQQAAQMKLQLQQEQAAADLQLAREKQEADIALAWEKFEFERRLALEKAGLEERIAEHNAHLKGVSAAHAAHLADQKASTQRPGGSVAE